MDDTWYILNALTSGFGYYLWMLPKISFHTDAWEELGMSHEGRGGSPDDEGGAAGWMNGWTIFYWGWWISWGPFVGTFLARISKGRKLGPYIMCTLIVPSLWSYCVIGVFGAAQIRISNQAKSAGLDMSDAAHTFGHFADKTLIGYKQPDAATGAFKWQPVYDGTTRLYALGTSDVLFEHMAVYGGPGYTTFITLILLACIILYFVTSSDSASFVVDILAANGREEPPLVQKIFWGATEGIAAGALLLAGHASGNTTAAINAVKALPIVLGLPFTFLLFWISHSLLIICDEETGKIPIDRKCFKLFLFNFQPFSYISIFAPFITFGKISESWGGSKLICTIAYAIGWVLMILFLCLSAVDQAYSYWGPAMYISIAACTALARTAVRTRYGITGDMCSDMQACVFAFPWAMGQMVAQIDYENSGAPPVESKGDAPDPEKVGGGENLTDGTSPAI